MHAYVAMQITDCIIEASIKHPTDRIRNAAGEKTQSRETWAIAGEQSRLNSEVATSAVPW